MGETTSVLRDTGSYYEPSPQHVPQKLIQPGEKRYEYPHNFGYARQPGRQLSLIELLPPSILASTASSAGLLCSQWAEGVL
jgi:hypothetical protein